MKRRFFFFPGGDFFAFLRYNCENLLAVNLSFAEAAKSSKLAGDMFVGSSDSL